MAENPIVLFLALLVVVGMVWRLLPRKGGTHRYTSTACEHGWHARCRRRCKFCNEPCRCPCHGVRFVVEEEPA